MFSKAVEVCINHSLNLMLKKVVWSQHWRIWSFFFFFWKAGSCDTCVWVRKCQHSWCNSDPVQDSRLLIKDGGGSEARVWKSGKLCKAGKVLVDVWKPLIEAWEELERLVNIGRPLFETWESLTMLLVIWAPWFETQESLLRLIEASKPPINTLEGWGLEAAFQDTRRLIKVGRSSYVNLGNLSKSGKGSCRCLEASLNDLSRLVEIWNLL